MATRKEKDILVDVLKDKTRYVDFTKMIKEQRETIRKLERMTNGKPDKIEQAYFDKQNAKLQDLEGIVKSWIWEAFQDDDEIVSKTMYWQDIQKNFTIEVMIKKEY